ncbi:hypothetical protein QS306_00020 [Paraburkholderia bonniea]|uniref:hypothetical protein n=1 Tax=Paraburkholderia bonniea TaxID=2152891 RepID=UPI0012929918|nr:hypothetical protein [Paraburkholderia bonniea]WJF90121.1 hypothetical protein QS306_00020 [Paraburkholderia bonniea]WJF93435.1 hypothetical protein QS308_00020 [Paraburkholderia bonniea]
MTCIRFVATLCLTLGLTPVFAATPLDLGTQLSASERKAFVSGAPVQLGQESFQIVSPAIAAKSASGYGSNETWVVNDRGVVGRNANEVLVGQIDPNLVKTVADSGALPRVAAATYNPTTRISSLRFGSFADAVKARAVLASRLSGASVTVPVQYDRPKMR